MIRKLNNEASNADWTLGCGAPKETSNNSQEVTVAELKQKVANYRKVMTNDFGVPDKTVLRMINININHLKKFMEANSNDLAAARIYITKSTSSKEMDDFELLFVPCKEKADEKNPDNVYFQDMLDDQSDSEANIISVMCRRPPGCEAGAVLL